MNNDQNGLIGFTGFVGSTLARQTSFTALYRSTSIAEIDHRSFDTLVCAGAPAQKWIANREPEADWQNIDGLITHLRTLTCKTFILISTVDVFKTAVEVDEDSTVVEAGLHPYGLHRRRLEQFVEAHFPRHLIVRLPGLVGPGLRKNVIFDLLHHNNLQAIDSRGVFQFYPMVNLWFDLQIALNAGLQRIHLTAAPISVAALAQQGFGLAFENRLSTPPAIYDFRTRHADLFSSTGPYQYSVRETLQAIRAYAQSEPSTIHPDSRTGP
ncbi:pyridine nucleotide transhydrogenase [Pseudomonas sp. NA-150]|uniref:pyridine nucleotide transhydrogenase n=1 Tax=Pseudomonas sp. NA-150 TaxID=3367525 RepID=UPI0037C97C71